MPCNCENETPEEESQLTFANRKPRFLDATEPASGETLESPIESVERTGDRWHALDKLLNDSFGLISPAYLFMHFPSNR